ncbi:MAG TPA: signal peptidase II [Spirochaetota bacterium]|nr:signal peptidase II [Spirochaetota bacterium]HOS34163.1 signal peptidase II [Spirochaetota bacterium]HOS56932.1 signal peptidase II [Spirochaetota bacterium]HPK62776.1 signal peptidase II [Spirochaetota bacterium]HQF78824.1 signal peptidase II [Spirochaetota bacterium]
MKFKEFLEFRPKCAFCKIAILFSFIIVLTGADLIVKEIAYNNLRGQEDVVVIPGFWNFKYVENDDIGFSILSWLNKYLNKNQKWLFMVFLQASGSIVVIVFYFLSQNLKQLIPLALIISGALGNLINRIMKGYVVDYVMWYYKDFVWPIFNLADVYTVIGAILLMIVIFFFSKDDDFRLKNHVISNLSDEEKSAIIENLSSIEEEAQNDILSEKPENPDSDNIDTMDLS